MLIAAGLLIALAGTALAGARAEPVRVPVTVKGKSRR